MAVKVARVEVGGCATKGRWMGSAEAAVYLGVSRSTLKAWRKVRVVPFSRMGGSLRYCREELDEVLRRNHVAAMGISGIV